MTAQNTTLTYRQIFVFWIPLAATWMMMAIEGPFLSALIARLPEPKFNLAAYGVAYAFALLIESPVIMMMSAATALVRDISSYHKLKKFTIALSLAITLVMLVFLLPPVFRLIGQGLIGLPDHIAKLVHAACIALIPWPAAIGMRRFWQGVLINRNQTRRVAYGTVVRLVVMAITALVLFIWQILPEWLLEQRHCPRVCVRKHSPAILWCAAAL